MELIKRNIHMDRVKRSTVMQFTMEEDLNLPEDKPDISTLNLEKGEVVIEEICPGTDEVTVRGKLGYAILYHTRESGSSLVLLGGALPFEERIRMEGVLPSDTVTVEGTVERSMSITRSYSASSSAVNTTGSCCARPFIYSIVFSSTGKMPFFAPRPLPTMMATGVARPSAHGQLMTSTEMPRASA